VDIRRRRPRSVGRTVRRGAAALLVGVIALMPSPAAAQGVAATTLPGPVAATPTGPDPDTPVSLPVAGPATVLVPFGDPPHRYAPGHRGVDLAASPGSPVLAAADGVVTFAGPVAGRPVLTVRHDSGLRSSYEPVAATVSVGTRVRRGQPLGTSVGAGHASCAPAVCLHWGVRLPDDTYLDPMALLTGWRVRLWPWTGRPDEPDR
jgi:murein DD-endopeptidase MepM/ murein hydrolase activator NlpD